MHEDADRIGRQIIQAVPAVLRLSFMDSQDPDFDKATYDGLRFRAVLPTGMDVSEALAAFSSIGILPDFRRSRDGAFTLLAFFNLPRDWKSPPNH